MLLFENKLKSGSLKDEAPKWPRGHQNQQAHPTES